MMKPKQSINLLLICFVCYLQMGKASENNLETRLHLFNAAFIQADVEQLNGMLADNYQHTNAGNLPINKVKWLEWIASRQTAVKSGKLAYEDYKVEDLVIQSYDNFAVITGRNIAKGVNHGKPFEIDIRFTHVWVKEGESWKRLSFHDSPVTNR